MQLLPTPVFIILPYCRKYNSVLSLFALLSIAMSVYALQVFNSSIPWLGIDIQRFNFFTKLGGSNDPKNSNSSKTSRNIRSAAPQIALTPLEKYLTPLNIILALTILLSGYVEHRPWRGYDYIWALPLFTVITTVCFRKWIADARQSLTGLQHSKYPYKGA